ncbi:Leucine-rich repeat and IQ domain-containing protein 1 [Bulinus truncatus]|nr:Leucine-rich repeat and IQ domain-containing protein 1 [Bulinus truncatus]
MLLKEVAEDDFTEDKLAQEYDEFIQLQKELADLRSGIEETIFRSDNSDLLLAIEAPKDGTENIELKADSVSDSLNSTDLLASYQNKHGLLSDHQKAGQLVSVAALSCMRDFIHDQLKKNEEVFQARQKNLLESIQNHRHVEERQRLMEENRKKTFQQQMSEEHSAMMERKKERQEKLEEELKALDDDFKEELNYHQVQINELSKDLESEKNHYEALRTHWMLSLEETRRKAATEIQRIYRGYRTRQLNTSTLKKFEELKVVRKKERFNIRVLEVEYEMKYQQEQEKKKKEQEEADEKKKRLEEDQQRQLELKRKEEEMRLEEEKRKELERIREQEKIEEERKKREEEKKKEEEKMRKEEEKLKKKEEKKRKEEVKKRLKEEERLRKEDEKRKKEEEKQLKEEAERKRKEEDKHKQKEERRLKEEEERKKEEKSKIKEEEDEKKIKEEMKVNNEKQTAGVESSLATNQDDSPNHLDSNVNNNHTACHEENQESPKNPIKLSFTPRPPPCPPPATSSWSPAPGPVVSPSSAPAPMPPAVPQPDPIEVLRLSWIKSCIPWSNVANEPWKLVQSTQNTQKRPVSAKKKFSPVLESVILTAAHAETLRQVSSVALCDLPGCSLSTLGQCWSLKYLTITHCNLVCLDSLTSCKHLLYINAEYNSVEYVDLKDLGNLQVVKLANNKLGAIHGLDGCINLRWLDISRNNITKLGGLASLRRLHTLNASYNQIISTEGLEKVVTLQELDLSHNFLQQMSGIQKLCLLTRLELSSNNLLQVPELKNQVLLQVLNLQENSIKSMGSLNKFWLPLLYSLNCSENMLENVDGVSHLIMLKHLDVSGNQITESENLIHVLKSIQLMETLNLEGNPVVDVDKSGTSLLTVKLNFLQTLNGENLQRVASNKEEILANVNNSDFYKMCMNQISLHTTLRNELDNQIKSFLTASKVSSEVVCQVYFSYCETSFKMANENRNAHEYGCMDTDSSIGKFKNPISPAQGVKNVDIKENNKLLVNKNAAIAVNSHLEPAENKKNLSETLVQMSGKSLNKNASVHIGKKNKVGTKNGPLMSANDDSNFTDLSDSSDDYTGVTAAGSYTQLPPPTMNSYINEKDKFNLAIAGSTKVSPQQPVKNANNNHYEKEVSNNLFHAASSNLQNKNTPEFASQKGMFEMALQNQNIANNGIKDSTTSESSNFASYSRADNMSDNPKPVSGVNASVTEGHYEPNEKNNWSNEVDPDHLVDLDDAAFDIDKYLEMDFELDEFLDLGWRPSDEAQIPQSSYPVLRKISSSNSISKPMEPTPPSEPMQAWKDTHVLTENRGRNSQLNTHGVIPPVARPSPVPSSVASAAETIEGSRGRSKMDEILQDWGFKDAHTAELMLARAKKMKYNAEKKQKLSKLDPKQRLLLFRKLEESGKILSVRPPNVKTLPRKEYFQAREEEIIQQNLQRQAEEHSRNNRTYEWIHTQVGDYPISSSRINGGRTSNDVVMDNSFKTEKLWDSRKTSPLSDHKSTSLHRGAEAHVRRFSLGDENSGHSPLLPPIHKQERISFRDSPVDKSTGWGGGKKRGQKS